MKLILMTTALVFSASMAMAVGNNVPPEKPKTETPETKPEPKTRAPKTSPRPKARPKKESEPARERSERECPIDEADRVWWGGCKRKKNAPAAVTEEPVFEGKL